MLTAGNVNMDAARDISQNVKPPPLTSDQLNYLIWRYLQDSGYGEAAVKLQRDWNVDPQKLPFANRIGEQALVSLVQKGLRMHHLTQTLDKDGGPPLALEPQMFYFGPESARRAAPQSRPVDMSLTTESMSMSTPQAPATVPRKHGRDMLNGPENATPPAVKRSRKPGNANGMERHSAAQQPSAAAAAAASPGDAMDLDVPPAPAPAHDAPSPTPKEPTNQAPPRVVNGAKTDSRMDVDSDAGAAPPSAGADPPGHIQAREPMAIEVPPPIFTLTHGESIGIQVSPAKVADLKPTTTLLAVPPGQHVTNTLWRPGDAAILAASGEHSCGLWKLSSPSLRPAAESPPYQPLIRTDENVTVSTVAWSPSGSLLAVATYVDMAGQLQIYDGQQLVLMESLPAAHNIVSILRWHKSGTRLVGYSYGQQGSSLLFWDLSALHDSPGLISVTVNEYLFDLDWATHGDSDVVAAAGEGVAYQCRAVTDMSIDHRWTSDPTEQNLWAYVRCAWWGEDSAVLIAASTEPAHLWMPDQNVLLRNVHNGAITGLELRPRRPAALLDGKTGYEFATSSLDNTIKMWQLATGPAGGHSIFPLFKVSMGHRWPVMALRYSPDGACLAGASYDKVLIWNADHTSQPVAVWESPDTDDEWRGAALKNGGTEESITVGGAVGATINGERGAAGDDSGADNTDHFLSWDAESKKLAFGLGSQIAVVNFQR